MMTVALARSEQLELKTTHYACVCVCVSFCVSVTEHMFKIAISLPVTRAHAYTRVVTDDRTARLNTEKLQDI